MGGRRVAGDGIDPAAGTRFRLRPAPVRLPDRILPRVNRLRTALSDHRMARHVHGGCAAGAARALHSPTRAGIADLGPCGGRAQRHVFDSHIALAPRPLCGGADDRVQLLQPRHPGSLSDFSPRAARPVAACGGTIAAIYNVGAILGGILCGSLSERIGRRRMIVIAALLSLPVLPLWAFSDSPYRSRSAPS